MVELRWMIRPGTHVRVLQYRTLKEQIIYSGAPVPNAEKQRRELAWTEWCNVPEVKEQS